MSLNIDYHVRGVIMSAVELGRQQMRIRKRYLTHVGGFVRKTAQRMLRPARKIRPSELPDEEREEYREDMAEFRAGLRDKPKLRDIISKPGDPPLLHMKPSPLKRGIKFEVSPTAYSVVVGPERDKEGIAGDLEFGRGKIKRARPVMRPAFRKVQPRLPDMLRQAISKG